MELVYQIIILALCIALAIESNYVLRVSRQNKALDILTGAQMTFIKKLIEGYEKKEDNKDDEV